MEILVFNIAAAFKRNIIKNNKGDIKDRGRACQRDSLKKQHNLTNIDFIRLFKNSREWKKYQELLNIYLGFKFKTLELMFPLYYLYYSFKNLSGLRSAF